MFFMRRKYFERRDCYTIAQLRKRICLEVGASHGAKGEVEVWRDPDSRRRVYADCANSREFHLSQSVKSV